MGSSKSPYKKAVEISDTFHGPSAVEISQFFYPSQPVLLVVREMYMTFHGTTSSYTSEHIRSEIRKLQLSQERFELLRICGNGNRSYNLMYNI